MSVTVQRQELCVFERRRRKSQSLKVKVMKKMKKRKASNYLIEKPKGRKKIKGKINQKERGTFAWLLQEKKIMSVSRSELQLRARQNQKKSPKLDDQYQKQKINGMSQVFAKKRHTNENERPHQRRLKPKKGS